MAGDLLTKSHPMIRKQQVQNTLLTKSGGSYQSGVDKFDVKLILDVTGSFEDEYRDGLVDGLLNAIFPIALELDRNGEMEVFAFDVRTYPLPVMNMSNYSGYVYQHIWDQPARRWKNSRFGNGTYYAQAMETMLSDLQPNVAHPNDPVLVIFVTDGDNHDKDDMTRLMKMCSYLPVMVLFTTISKYTSEEEQAAEFPYLAQLDELKLEDPDNIAVDNADLTGIHLRSAVVSKIYEGMLKEVGKYIAEAKKANVLPWVSDTTWRNISSLKQRIDRAQEQSGYRQQKRDAANQKKKQQKRGFRFW